jgi:hypothetical protein
MAWRTSVTMVRLIPAEVCDRGHMDRKARGEVLVPILSVTSSGTRQPLKRGLEDEPADYQHELTSDHLPWRFRRSWRGRVGQGIVYPDEGWGASVDDSGPGVEDQFQLKPLYPRSM